MSGRAFVFLHGFTGDGASWESILDGLGHPRALCPDLLGHGSGGQAATFDDEVDRIAELARAGGFESAHLVGYSLGARVGLGVLVRHPELFARATLVGVNPGLKSDAERQERVRADERWAELAEREGVLRFIEAWQAQPLFATQERLPEAVRAAQQARRARQTPAGLARSLRTLGLGRMPNYWPALAAIRPPLQLVVGGEDAKFRRIAEEMTAVRPARLTVVPGVGHNVPLEAPQAFVAALEADA